MTAAPTNPTPPNTPPRPGRRLDLASELRLVTQRTARRIRSESDPASLTEGQYCVLGTLTRHGPATPRELAAADGVQPPTMTRTLASLEAQGLVGRGPHPSDGRQVIISLTEAGTGLVRETTRRRTEWVAKRLARLTTQERATLREAVTILREMVRE